MKTGFSNKRIISIIISIVIILISSFVFAMDFLDTGVSAETKRIKTTLENHSFYVVNFVGLSEHSIHMEGATIDWHEGEEARKRFLSYDTSELSDEYLYYYTLYMWLSGHVDEVNDMRSFIETRGLSKPWTDHFNFFMGAVSYVSHDYEMAYSYLNSVESFALYGEVYNQLTQLVSGALNDERYAFKNTQEAISKEYEAIARLYSNLDKYNYEILSKIQSAQNELKFEKLDRPFEGVLVVSATGKAVYSDFMGVAKLDSEASIFYIPWQRIHNTSLDMRNWKTKNKFHFKEGIDLFVELKENDTVAYSLSPRNHVLIKNERVSLHVQNGTNESIIPLFHESGQYSLSDIKYSSPYEEESKNKIQYYRCNIEVDGYQNGFFSTALSKKISIVKEQ